ncbi:MAG TPA: TM0106 family RecB-like putative nuclease [Candidatus Limnocylindria bacterium]|nr:TM0106 family RecB-like putative nuclease [Candidatus Limnocylindria bacterium]
MQRLNDQFLFSPSDLGGFLACEHLTQLDLAVALRQGRRPSYENAYAELLRTKGQEHEQAFLATLREGGRRVVEVRLDAARDFEAGMRRTAEAMRAGADYVYQAVFLSQGWRGIADFLERVERPSALGAWSYQVLDTKLARHPRPEHALQLSFYSQALEQVQQLAPDLAYVVLGTRERVPIRLADVTAYFRRVRERFGVAVGARPATGPYPCHHCSFCDYRRPCEDQLEREDHVVRVAGIQRTQVKRLFAGGIGTLAALAETVPGTAVARIAASTLQGLREQAALQLVRQRTGSLEWRALDVEAGRGFAALPPRSPGDVIFDLEGHPFFEPARGLEYLFGVLLLDGPEPRYQAFWAHDRDGERRAFEDLVDLVHARLVRHPGLHVYHFSGSEPSTLKRLMAEHLSREAQVDDLLRREVFVDLHTILRRALRAGVPSYSLKDVEALFGFTRGGPVQSGTQAILHYERWMHRRDQTLLDEIAAYNRDDCRATLGLREWLHRVRPTDLPWPEPPEAKPLAPEATEALDARQRLRQELVDGAEPGSSPWLAGELLEYHRREARPAWWAYFDRLGKSPDELLEDTEAIAYLAVDGGTPPRPLKRSLVHTLTFPLQDHKLRPGLQAQDPATGRPAGEIFEIDDTSGPVGILRLVRGAKVGAGPLPEAIVAGGPIENRTQRGAVLRVAASIRAGDGRYPALRAILARERPRIRGLALDAGVQTTNLEEMKARALGLDASYLFLQGPPGTGKTWTGARIVAHLLAHRRRVGIAAQSHKAIHNLLAEIEKVARATGVRFKGLKKSSGNPDSEYDGEFIQHADDNAAIEDAGPDIRLFAGTAWLFSREKLDGVLDDLVIDEAGQVALADAVAMGTCARNLILLGDPLQLAQVSQGVHPQGAGASVLEHLLGDATTIPEDRGVFLERSFRMHPGVADFISEIVYAGRLHADDSAARRTTSFGTGIRFAPVDHDGNRSSSDEEVAEIAKRIADMRGGTFTDADGTTRPLRDADFMVVAPYNAQVVRLRTALPAGVRVGTVDKFQGQEAPIVFFSMATSSGEDVPRSLSFLFSRNRLNVAISRAQCLAVLVCSPRLLEARCQSLEEMQLVNALCRLAEYAAPEGGSA